MMIILVAVARTSEWAAIRDAEAQALASAPDRAAAPAPSHMPDDVYVAGAALSEGESRQAMAGGSTRLLIETIGVDAPIQPVGLIEMEEGGRNYSQWQVPDDYAVGWHRTSAGLGSPGNIVLNGHNNAHGAVFRDLAGLGLGEEIVLVQDQQTFRYRVARRELLEENDQPLSVRLDNAKWIAPTPDERLTLISCWPYVGTTHRVIVIATPSDGD